MSLVRRFYPKRLTYIQYCGQSPQEQFGVKCFAQGHNDMLQWDSNLVYIITNDKWNTNNLVNNLKNKKINKNCNSNVNLKNAATNESI